MFTRLRDWLFAPTRLEKQQVEVLYEFASRWVEEHGMNGDDTMTDKEHRDWQDSTPPLILSRKEER